MKRKLTSPKVQTAGIALLAALLLWLFFRGSDLGAILESFGRADRELLAASLVATLATYVVRAWRWQGLLSPLGHAGLGNCFSTTVIGFMMNFLAGRLGEVARPYLLARREGFAASGAFATILLERALDLVSVVFLVGLWLLLGPRPARSDEVVSALELGGLLGLAGAVIALLSMFLFARYPDRALALFGRMFRVLPRSLAAKGLGFLETFRGGLGVLVEAGSLAKAASLSLLLWLSVGLAFWFVARAFGVQFDFRHTFLVLGFLTVGVAVPTPGAIGGYHYMCALALTTLFGTEASLARAVALAAHAISFIPVTLLGIVFFTKAGLSFRQIAT